MPEEEVEPTHQTILRVMLRMPDCEGSSYQLFSWLEPHAAFERTLERVSHGPFIRLHMEEGVEPPMWEQHLAVYHHMRPLIQKGWVRAIAPPGYGAQDQMKELLSKLEKGKMAVSPHLDSIHYALTAAGLPEAKKFRDKW